MILKGLKNKGYIILDNLFDDLFIHEIDHLTNYLNWGYTNKANRKSYPYGTVSSHTFWGALLYEKKDGRNIVNTCHEKIWGMYDFLTHQVFESNFDLNAIDVNGQTIYQEGTTHVDHERSDYSLMYFVNSKWEKGWGGEFEFDSTNLKDKVDFVPGRVILFDGRIPHKAWAPKIPNVLRKTIVFRVNLLNN